MMMKDREGNHNQTSKHKIQQVNIRYGINIAMNKGTYKKYVKWNFWSSMIDDIQLCFEKLSSSWKLDISKIKGTTYT